MTKRNLIHLAIIGLFMFASLTAGLNLISKGSTVDQEAMAAANQLYEVGHHKEAAKIYEQLVLQGVQSSALYYNLGNAYYQQDDLGRAILNFQLAAQLDPRDDDIQANLRLARVKAVNLYPDEPGGPLKSLADLSGNWLTLNETAWLALSTWFLLGYLVIAWRQLQPSWIREGVKYTLLLVFTVLLIGVISLSSRIYTEQNQPGGVIIAPVVAVSSNPSAEQPTNLELHSGTEVHLRETLGDWIRLDLPGITEGGWIPLEAVEFIAKELRDSV